MTSLFCVGNGHCVVTGAFVVDDVTAIGAIVSKLFALLLLLSLANVLRPSCCWMRCGIVMIDPLPRSTCLFSTATTKYNRNIK